MSTPLAVFDFDNTLTTQDSIVPYLLYCRRKGLCGWGHLLRSGFAWLGQKLDPSRVVSAKNVSLSFLKGMTEAALDELAQGFFDQVMRRKLLPGGLAQLKRLRESGWRIIIISASADVYMRRFGRLLPVDDVLCTRAQHDADGRFTGRIESNCRGEEKVRRLKEWLAAQDTELQVMAGYGDSMGDVPMLRFAREAVLVDPSRKVRRALPHARVVHWHRKGE